MKKFFPLSCIFVLNALITVSSAQGAEVDTSSKTKSLYSIKELDVPVPVQSAEYANAVYTPNFKGVGYYVDSNKGDDANSGKENAPWRTLARASRATLSPGDALLLRCGSVWREEFSLDGNTFAPKGGVLIAAYGPCNKNNRPIVTGSDIVETTWARDERSTNIVSTQLNQSVGQVFLDGTKLTPARYPNYSGGSEYSLTPSFASGQAFSLSSSDEALLGNKDLVGATAHVRVEPWIIESRVVTNFSQAQKSTRGQVTLASPLTYPGEAGDGYMFEGKRWMLDTPGEWYQDPTTNKLSFLPPTGTDPAQSVIEVSVRPSTLRVKNLKNSDIEFITFERSTNYGVTLESSPNLTVRDVIVRDDKVGNLLIVSLDDFRLESSALSGAAQYGVRSEGNNHRTTFKKNVITNIGLPGTGGNTVAAMLIAADDAQVEGNTITNIGYNGIVFNNHPGTIIRNNTITNVCLRLSDCAGIYTYNGPKTFNPNVQTRVENNVVVSAPGNRDGEAGYTGPSAGIFLDNFTTNVAVTGNMISDTSVGILLNEANNTLIRNNKTWKTSSAGLSVTGGPGTVLRNNVSENIFYAASYFSTATTGVPISTVARAQVWSPGVSAADNFGVNGNQVSRNVVVTHNDKNTQLWQYTVAGNDTFFTQKAWNAFAPTDEVRTTSPVELARFKTVRSLIQNGFMSGTGTPWSSYASSPGAGVLSFGAFKQCDTSCAKFSPRSGTDLLMSNTFNLAPQSRNSLYYVALTELSGSTSVQGHATIRRTSAPYQSLGYDRALPALVPGDRVAQKNFFTAQGNGLARLDLYGEAGKDIYYDDVILAEVSGVTLFNPYTHSVHLINRTDSSMKFTCAKAGVFSCRAVDDSLRKVTWPYVLKPHTSSILMTVPR